MLSVFLKKVISFFKCEAYFLTYILVYGYICFLNCVVGFLLAVLILLGHGFRNLVPSENIHYNLY